MRDSVTTIYREQEGVCVCVCVCVCLCVCMCVCVCVSVCQRRGRGKSWPCFNLSRCHPFVAFLWGCLVLCLCNILARLADNHRFRSTLTSQHVLELMLLTKLYLSTKYNVQERWAEVLVSEVSQCTCVYACVSVPARVCVCVCVCVFCFCINSDVLPVNVAGLCWCDSDLHVRPESRARPVRPTPRHWNPEVCGVVRELQCSAHRAGTEVLPRTSQSSPTPRYIFFFCGGGGNCLFAGDYEKLADEECITQFLHVSPPFACLWRAASNYRSFDGCCAALFVFVHGNPLTSTSGSFVLGVSLCSFAGWRKRVKRTQALRPWTQARCLPGQMLCMRT